ncbi:lethal(2)neighbour of tid protein 2 [Drosophila guanche]|uniref:dolichyl-P-Man:Man5GlcNAc2-PP-dolichol alpha-1,3-mannosyltransferase n=1 Tax=Drosophila guanche TaxID=7266 RepID=A0A3B0J1Y0_DROGU|nr:lethal(2)neighbour of tid protein 2 [Drosophila guanche]SPP72972.1 blast:Lethal(2)neighbour of tid protein [Drosophila guanche]
MAPPKGNNNRPAVRRKKSSNLLPSLVDKYLNVAFLRYLVLEPAALPIISVLIILAEAAINVFVIRRVPYTEIDWVAYMQECEGFLNGTTNYAQLRGDTGPLVYPAAFVYIYSALYYITSHGANVRVAQYIFAGIYLLQMFLVLRLYSKSRKVPPYVLVLSAFTSYRIHSIYVLRLFNDPVAVLLLYAALNLFMDRRWTWGSIFFSLAVGVKMNILLFAPALLLFYLANLGVLKTVLQLSVCGVIQLLLGAPFLLSHPVEYLRGSFDLGRIFEHKWTVNYRFLSREFFENRTFHLSLLGLHLLLLLAFAKPTWTFFQSYVRLRSVQEQLQPQLAKKNSEVQAQKRAKKEAKKQQQDTEELSSEQKSFLKAFEKSLQKCAGGTAAPTASPVAPPKPESERYDIHFDRCTQLALLPFFLCNFIGVACARSLHYQFYVWYFHSLPYLVWSTNYSLGVRYLILGIIEYCWNSYPSTQLSSAALHLCHLVLLLGVARQIYQTMRINAAVKQQQLQQQKKVQ